MSRNLHLGRSRNAQYGICRMTVNPEKNLLPYNENVGTQNSSQGNRYFLRAQTPYIPLKDWQRVDKIAVDLLAVLSSKLQLELNPVAEKNFAAVEEIDSYVGVWKLKRERKNSLAAGSLICFETDQPLDQASWKELSSLLYAGVGDRTIEGYGQFRLWQALEQLSQGEAVADFECPENLEPVVKIAKDILHKRILAEVHKKAELDAKEIKNAYTVKSALKRVELLMDSTRSKSELKAIIRAFKGETRDNLSIRLRGKKIISILLEDYNDWAEYERTDWLKLLLPELAKNESKRNQLLEDLGIDAFQIDKDELYREYWLWLTRFAGKQSDTSEEGENLK